MPVCVGEVSGESCGRKEISIAIKAMTSAKL